jgi:hypothetical protein
MVTISAIDAVLQARGVSGHAGVDYTLRDDGEGAYIETWNTTVLGAQPTTAELSTVAQGPEPRNVRTREILRQMTPNEHLALATLALRDPVVCHAHHMLLAGEWVNTRSQEFQRGWQYVKQIAVPMIWATSAEADARIEMIIGEPLEQIAEIPQ